MSTVPVPVRAATVAGTILAVIFITLSAVVGGVNVWRTRSAATYEPRPARPYPRRPPSTSRLLRPRPTSRPLTPTETPPHGAASVTRDKAGSMRDVVKSYDSATQAVKEPSTPNAPTRSPCQRAAHTIGL